MPAPTQPDSLLVKFLFTAPCLLAILSITCQRDTEPQAATGQPQGPVAEPESVATTPAA